MMKAAPPRGARLAALLCCVVRGCAKKVAISEPLSWAAWLAAQEAHVRAWLAMHATVVLAWVAWFAIVAGGLALLPRSAPPSAGEKPRPTTPAGKCVGSPFEFPLVGELDPSTTALLVIDLQRDFTERGGYMEAMGYDIAPLASPLPRVARVLAACRDRGFRIVHTRQGFRRDLADLTPYLIERYNRSGVEIGASGPLGRVFVRGERGWEINSAVAPLGNEPVVDKTANSAFVGTDLDLILRGWRVDKLIICGNTLDCCVHCTLRHAADLQYQTLLLADCCGCVEEAPGLRKAMIDSVKVEGGLFGTVADSKALLTAISTGKTAKIDC